MIQNILSVTALLTSFALLCLGHGLQSVVIPARSAVFEDYPNLATSAMMSAYYIGFIIGTFISPKIILRVGHIRTFAACSACASIIMLFHSLFPNPIFWILIRIMYGFCFVHLYTVMESWLNSIGNIQSRGKILSIYMILNFLAMGGGQLLFFTAPADGFELFIISAILISLSIIPLTLGRSVQPSYVASPNKFGIKQLFAVSPLGVYGALIAGLMGGAYWGMTAIFIIKMGYDQSATALFMSASLIGGLVAQWPLGSLSDRINRRWVIIIAATLICLSSGLLFFMSLWEAPAEIFSTLWLVVIGALFGTGFHPLYSLCIAHANDFVEDINFVPASAGLQSVQGFGATIGPLIAGLLMYLGGHKMLFAYIGILAGLFVFYTIRRMAENRTPSKDKLSPFRFITRTGVFAFFMDPRSKF